MEEIRTKRKTQTDKICFWKNNLVFKWNKKDLGIEKKLVKLQERARKSKAKDEKINVKRKSLGKRYAENAIIIEERRR